MYIIIFAKCFNIYVNRLNYLVAFFAQEQTWQEQIIAIIDNPGGGRAPVVVVPFEQVRRWRYNGG